MGLAGRGGAAAGSAGAPAGGAADAPGGGAATTTAPTSAATPTAAPGGATSSGATAAAGPAPATATGSAPATTTASGPATTTATGPATATAQPTTAPATTPPAAVTAAPTSLTEGASYTAYATAAQTVKTGWAGYADADARGRALGQAACAALTAIGVHPPTIVMADLPAGNGGNFAYTTWSLTLARLPFQPATVTDAVFDNPYTAVYHEARHCEQWFKMARLRAGAGRTAAQIKTDMAGLDAGAAAAAHANPIAPGTAEATEAQVWWDSVYGTGGTNRTAVLTEVMAALGAYNTAKSADTAASTPATQQALTAATTRFNTAYAAYRALPEEADAFGTETAARAALTAAAARAASAGAAPGGTAPATPPPPGATTPPAAATPPATPAATH